MGLIPFAPSFPRPFPRPNNSIPTWQLLWPRWRNRLLLCLFWRLQVEPKATTPRVHHRRHLTSIAFIRAGRMPYIRVKQVQRALATHRHSCAIKLVTELFESLVHFCPSLSGQTLERLDLNASKFTDFDLKFIERLARALLTPLYQPPI